MDAGDGMGISGEERIGVAVVDFAADDAAGSNVD